MPAERNTRWSVPVFPFCMKDYLRVRNAPLHDRAAGITHMYLPDTDKRPAQTRPVKNKRFRLFKINV